jgi:DNA-binding transcriptional LysR family regulator
MLDLVQLRSFLAVEQMASFTLAAERLGLGQSTVSRKRVGHPTYLSDC